MNNPFTQITQIGIITKDINRSCESIKKLFGADPYLVSHVSAEDHEYRGSPAQCDAIIALFNFANVDLELIQPLHGESLWQEHLDQIGEGLHHIRFTTDSQQETIAYMQQQGYLPIQSGKSVAQEGYGWDYYETKSALGFEIETFGSDHAMKG